MKRFLLIWLVIPLAGCGFSRLDTIASARAPFNPNAAIEEVAMNEARVKRDPRGAIAWAQLSASYLVLARQREDNDYAEKSERAARTSLSIRRKNNVGAAVHLARSILEQHRFADALRAVDDAIRIEPRDPSAHLLRAEILAEVGKYDEARNVYEKYEFPRTDPSRLTLKARLLEIDGDADDAEMLLRQAARLIDDSWDAPRESVAWYHTKLGSLLWGRGKLDEAHEQFTIATELWPHDFRAFGGLAKIAAAKGGFAEAIAFGEKSIGVVPTVEVASLLADIAEKQGDTNGAARYAMVIDKISHPGFYRALRDPAALLKEAPHTHDRLYATYCADHRRDLAGALTAARKDLEARQDVYAYDTLAWVLHQVGRTEEARKFSLKALARGTRDTRMLYHAGMIESALGNRKQATNLLSRALSINPTFQFRHDILAARELAKLKGAQGE